MKRYCNPRRAVLAVAAALVMITGLEALDATASDISFLSGASKRRWHQTCPDPALTAHQALPFFPVSHVLSV